ncbi:MAG: hypothetical protein WC551_10100 [Patescibacteria group bacterium]
MSHFGQQPGSWIFKARQDGDRRIVEIEPSVEKRDLQDEKVLLAALWENRDYFLEKGNLDLDHISWKGIKLGIPNYDDYIVGKPLEVKGGPDRPIVVGEISRGGAQADSLWERMTKWEPPVKYWPSVGAVPVEKFQDYDEDGKPVNVHAKVRWINIAFCKEPVNQYVPAIEIVSTQMLAKAFGGTDIEFPDAHAVAMAIAGRSMDKVEQYAHSIGMRGTEVDLLMDRINTALSAGSRLAGIR